MSTPSIENLLNAIVDMHGRLSIYGDTSIESDCHLDAHIEDVTFRIHYTYDGDPANLRRGVVLHYTTIKIFVDKVLILKFSEQGLEWIRNTPALEKYILEALLKLEARAEEKRTSALLEAEKNKHAQMTHATNVLRRFT